ncbi:glycosyltransferase family 4 protein [candidate division WOR-3 bacterium]|nr:glycosyltransferase family 4 protein [candidate division WOR-3 bacterium]
MHILARAFKRQGHAVVVIVPNSRGLREFKLPYSVETFPSIFYKFRLKTFIEIMSLIYFQHKYKFDVINIHKTYVGYPAGKIKNLLKIPIIITAHGGDIQKYPEINYGKRLNPKWEKKISFSIRKADGLIAISEETKKNFIDLGTKEENIYRIPNGVDIERFKECSSLGEQIKKDGKKIILAVGRYHIKKGFESLLKAIQILSKQRDDFKLVIVGKRLQKLAPVIDKLNIANFVELVKQQKGEMGNNIFPNNYLLSFYKSSDIFVSASLMEGFSLVCVEAMAAGLPLVITKCPGNEDVFNEKEDQCGYYVPPGDYNKMAENLLILLKKDELRKKMGENSRRIAMQRYDWNIIVKQYLVVFNKILNRTK